MKNNWLIMTAAVALMAFATTVQAIPITGSVTFAGGVTLDTGSVGTATKVTAWNGGNGGPALPFVLSSGGNLTAPFGTSVLFATPWLLGTQAALWSYTVAGTTFTFDLTAANPKVVSGSPLTLSVTGSGVIHVSGVNPLGLTDTAGSWAFSTQDPSAGTPATFSFSAASGSVPDGGTTVLLLGAALSSLSLIRRKLAA